MLTKGQITTIINKHGLTNYEASVLMGKSNTYLSSIFSRLEAHEEVHKKASALFLEAFEDDCKPYLNDRQREILKAIDITKVRNTPVVRQSINFSQTKPADPLLLRVKTRLFGLVNSSKSISDMNMTLTDELLGLIIHATAQERR